MQKCKWYFNPPAAPHMGGVWERQIQTVKKNLYEVLKEKYPQEHALKTIFCEIEFIVNSRPLTHVPLDTEDSDPLTPNHFLIGFKYTNFGCVDTTNEDLNLINRWKSTQKLIDHFWKRWTKEYLPTLLIGNKWKKNFPI